jgi:two-component system, cell cycle response regulator DivK
MVPRPRSPAPTTPPSRRRGAPAPRAYRPLVLIVDPNDDARRILRALLSHAGYEVIATADPGRALRLARKHRPDVIVGEHPLSVPGGRLLCAALHEDPTTSGIPFVVATSRAVPDEVRHAEEGHPMGVFTKPLDLARLLERVQALCCQEEAVR